MKHKREIHGMWGTRFYIIWQSIKGRCSLETNTGWKKYGKKGITVNKDWNSFIKFKDDMYKGYLLHSERHGEKNTRLIRVDKNILENGFSKENCRWMTFDEQLNSRNKQNGKKFNKVKLINYGGKRLRLKDLAKEINISVGGLHYRIKNKLDIFSEKKKILKNNKKFNFSIIKKIFKKWWNKFK